MLLVARIVFAQHWKKEETPSDEEIIKKILDCVEMDRLTLRMKEKEDSEYFQTWNLFYPWLEKREKRTSLLLKAEEELQKEKDGDDTNKLDVQWEENEKPYITRVSMIFYPGTENRSEENSAASSQSKIFKQKETSSVPQDSKLLENYRSLVLLLHQKDLEIQGLKSAAQKTPDDRLSYILQEIVKSKHKGLWKKSPSEEALQKEVDRLNADLNAVKEDYAQEMEDLKNKLTDLKLHIKKLHQKIKTLGVKLDDEIDSEFDISLAEEKILARESFELWSEVGKKASSDTNQVTLRRIPKHTSFMDAFPTIQNDFISTEEKEEFISRLASVSDALNLPIGGVSEGGSPESSGAESKLPSELSSDAILTSLKSDFALFESKVAKSSSSLPSLDDKVPEKKDLVSTLCPSNLAQFGLSLGWLSEEELCPHLMHDSLLQEYKRCCAETSTLRIISVHHKGKFIRIFNCLLTKEVDLSGYIIQQWVGGYPVSIYHFPKNVVLPAQHHITVWAAGVNLAHEPSSFSTAKFFKAGPNCLTTLCDRNGQMVSQYVNPHQFTAAAAAYSDNVDLSIDKFPLCDGKEETNESLYSKFSFCPRNSKQLSVDSSTSFKMWCDPSIGNKRKTNAEFKESSSDTDEDFSVMVFSHGNQHLRNQ